MIMKKLVTALLAVSAASLLAAVPTLENKKVRFQFTPENYALSGIKNLETGHTVKIQKPTSLWLLKLIDGNKAIADIAGDSPAAATIEREGSTQVMTLIWDGRIRKNDRWEVTMTITLPDNSSIADWHVTAKTNGKPALWIKELQFPRLENVASLGNDRLVYGHHLGRMVRSPGKRIGLTHIVSPGEWSMQFAAFFGSPSTPPDQFKSNEVIGYQRGIASDETGLFIAADDERHYHKVMHAERKPDNCFSLAILNYPVFPFWPADSGKRSGRFTYSMPYKIKLGTFSGGVGKAAALYRDIVKDRKDIKGKQIYVNSNVSKKVLDCVFWGKIYWSSNKVIPEILKMRDYLKVPVNTHWVRYSVNPFDDNNLNYFPSVANYREGVKTLREANIGVGPYICCGVWDKDTESYRRFGIKDAVALDEFLDPRVWILHHQVSYWMHPASPVWRKQYHDVTMKMFGQWDTDGQYLDVMAAGGFLSYNTALHKPHGGIYWADGNRRLMDSLKKGTSSVQENPYLVSEGFSESYIGKLDAYLMLDATRYAWRHRTAEEVYPLFSLVYHDYAVTYGSDCEQSLGIDDFRWQMGLHFVWGSQLCYSSYLIEDPGKTAHDVFTRDLAQAWHRSGYKYLTGGQGIEIAQTATEKEAGNAPAAVISRKVTVPLKDTMGKPFNWEGPAVPASAWKAYDNTIGFTMANISGKAQKIELIVGRKALNSQYETLWRTWPLPAVKLGKISDRTKMNLVLPADTCMILEIRDDSAPVIRPLTEQPSLTMAADSKGVFPVLNVKAGKLYGTDSAYTLHQNNSVKVCNAAGTPLKAKTHHWRYVEGIGGPRTPDYRTFHLLKDSGCTLTACKSASVRIISEIMTAEVELDKTAELKGAGKVLLATAENQLVYGQDTLKLRPGKYRIAAWNAEEAWQTPSSASLMNSLAAISVKAQKEGTALLTGDNILHSAVRKSGERMFALGNAATWIATGKKAEMVNTHDWLIPAKTMKVSYASPVSGNLKLLNTPHVGETEIIRSGTSSFDVTAGSIEATSNLFRMLFTATLSAGQNQFALSSLDYLEVAEPLIVEIPWDLEYINKSEYADVVHGKVQVANVSDLTLPIRISAELPDGWILDPGENKLDYELKGHTRAVYPLVFRMKDQKKSARKQTFTVKVNYSDKDYTTVYEDISVTNREMQIRKAAPGTDRESWTGIMRGHAMLAIPACKSKEVTLKFQRINVGPNPTSSLTWKVLNKKLEPVSTHTVSFKNNDPVEVKAPLIQSGDTYISIDCRFFKVAVSGVPNYGLTASVDDPFIMFTAEQEKDITVYFSVNEGAESFELRATDGGPLEQARIIVCDPAGKAVFNRYGRYSSSDAIRIPVKTGQDGKVWSMKIRPDQDLSVMLGNGAAPWLSMNKSAVIGNAAKQ